ncbi:MAG: hypothetical protein LBG65_02915 [Puniceicoccales bacterium]|nr:hypothetical protein [Puniceicoccales bacterium]
MDYFPLTEEELDKLEAEERARNAPWKPDGHAPIDFYLMMHSHFFVLEPGSPEFKKAQEEHDRKYFAAHPDEREKYGYTGP